MPIRRGVVVIPYIRKGNSVKFLVLERAMNWKGWEFPKGGIDEGESARDAAVRELKEETGLDVVEIKPTGLKCEYFYRREGATMKSEQEVFLAEVEDKPVIVSHEHSDFAWLSREDAEKRVTWKDQKELLKKIEI